MSSALFSWKKFYETPVVGIFRGFSIEKIQQIIPVYIESGFHTVEVTMNSPESKKSITMLASKYPNLNVGAGTVCSMNDLNDALNAGAQFIVTPIVNVEIINHCVVQKIPIFPGAYTPTEIYQAWNLGASAVKVFPATQLGVNYIKDILGPLNHIKLLPTGGVHQNNITQFMDAGCIGVGMGSSLFDEKLIGNLSALKMHFDEVKGLFSNFNVKS